MGLEKRLAELREIKASDRSPLERKELNKLRNSVNHAKETEEQRNQRLEKKRNAAAEAIASETLEENNQRLKTSESQLLKQ